jgi:hypothetical protein
VGDHDPPRAEGSILSCDGALVDTRCTLITVKHCIVHLPLSFRCCTLWFLVVFYQITHDSFGSAEDFSFDDAVVNVLGMEVHTFDPTMSWPQEKVQRRERAYKHGVGLAGEDLRGGDKRANQFAALHQKTQKWTVKRLSTIMRELQHDRLSILKIDVDGSEWWVLDDLLSSSVLDTVDILLFEVHFLPEYLSHRMPVRSAKVYTHDYVHAWYIYLLKLSEHFSLYCTHMNNHGEPRRVSQLSRVYYEISYIRRRSRH